MLGLDLTRSDLLEDDFEGVLPGFLVHLRLAVVHLVLYEAALLARTVNLVVPTEDFSFTGSHKHLGVGVGHLEDFGREVAGKAKVDR